MIGIGRAAITSILAHLPATVVLFLVGLRGPYGRLDGKNPPTERGTTLGETWTLPSRLVLEIVRARHGILSWYRPSVLLEG